jgi:transaldolase
MWLGDLSSDRLDAGGLAELIKIRNVVGVTNPTIFQLAMPKGTAYDDQLKKLAAAGTSNHDANSEAALMRCAKRLSPVAGRSVPATNIAAATPSRYFNDASAEPRHLDVESLRSG